MNHKQVCDLAERNMKTIVSNVFTCVQKVKKNGRQKCTKGRQKTTRFEVKIKERDMGKENKIKIKRKKEFKQSKKYFNEL